MRILAALFGLLTSALVTFAVIGPRLPPNWIPWATPDLDAPATSFAHVQLNHLKMNGEMCRAALQSAEELRFTQEPDRQINGDCSYKNVVRIKSAPVVHSAEPSMTCGLASGSGRAATIMGSARTAARRRAVNMESPELVRR